MFTTTDFAVAAATTLPVAPPQGMTYAVCLGALAFAAALYPATCLRAVRGRGGIGAAVAAAFLGSVGLLAGGVLSGQWRWAAPATLAYFGGIAALVTAYVIVRIATVRKRGG